MEGEDCTCVWEHEMIGLHREDICSKVRDLTLDPKGTEVKTGNKQVR